MSVTGCTVLGGSSQIKNPKADLCDVLVPITLNMSAANAMENSHLLKIENNNLALRGACGRES